MFYYFSQINPVVKFFALSNALLVTGVGLFGPLFAVYLAESIQTDQILAVIGVSAAILLFTRSVGQIPVAYIIDKLPGERDDYLILLLGNCIYFIVPLLYLLISEPWHLFAIQALYGFGTAMTYPTWLAIFTRHIDKGKEGVEWGGYQVMNDVSAAAAASIGGLLAALYGFTVIFYIASFIAFLGCITLLALRKTFIFSKVT